MLVQLLIDLMEGREVVQGSTIQMLVDVHANETPQAIAIAAPGRVSLTYDELRGHIRSVAAQFNSLGIGRGDRVAVVLPNGPEMAVAFLSIAERGGRGPVEPGVSRGRIWLLSRGSWYNGADHTSGAEVSGHRSGTGTRHPRHRPHPDSERSSGLICPGRHSTGIRN